jgi:hypothetical protein
MPGDPGFRSEDKMGNFPNSAGQIDPLFPAAALMALSEPGGVQYPVEHVPGTLRPFAATLGVPAPRDGKKHDTTATRWNETKVQQTSKDGQVVPDSVTVTHTDS